jgi:hypothetical protein
MTTANTALTNATHTSNGFVSILDHAGAVIKNFFTQELPVVLGVAIAAEPIIALALPSVSALFDSTVVMVANAQATGLAAAGNGATGEQKLASVVSALDPIATAYAKQNGINLGTANIQALVNAAVAFLKAIPAPTGSPAMGA